MKMSSNPSCSLASQKQESRNISPLPAHDEAAACRLSGPYCSSLAFCCAPVWLNRSEISETQQQC